MKSLKKKIKSACKILICLVQLSIPSVPSFSL